MEIEIDVISAGLIAGYAIGRLLTDMVMATASMIGAMKSHRMLHAFPEGL